jgi:hypothetical protein
MEQDFFSVKQQQVIKTCQIELVKKKLQTKANELITSLCLAVRSLTCSEYVSSFWEA